MQKVITVFLSLLLGVEFIAPLNIAGWVLGVMANPFMNGFSEGSEWVDRVADKMMAGLSDAKQK